MSSYYDGKNDERLKELESVIHYTFSDMKKLLLALTHSSFANEKKCDGLCSNERLEFLGDAVLNIVTSDYIYRNFPSLPEGELTKTRAAIVCEGSLMKCANRIGLGSYLMLGKGEENTGGRTRTSILSDAFEALIGAIYLDGGLQQASGFIFNIMSELFRDISSNELYKDYKTQFQELVQKKGEQRISYRILEEKGPDHDKVFVVQAYVGDNALGTGEGKSKKEAEQLAAKAALDNLKVNK